MKELETVDDFIAFFKSIPESKWCTKAYKSGNKKCALGHLGKDSENADNFRYLWYHYFKYDSIVSVNDEGRGDKTTPKKRILLALINLKKLQQLDNDERE